MTKKINFDTSIGEFTNKYPQSRDVFKEYKLDYCCGSKKNIALAVKEKNIDWEKFKSTLQKIINEPEIEEETKDWEYESLTSIMNHIQEKYHSFLWEKLASIDIQLSKLIQIHSDTHENFLLFLQSVFSMLKEKLERHLLDEEDLLFMYVRDFEKSLVTKGKKYTKDPHLTKELIENFREDHEDARDILSQMRSLTSNYKLPDLACSKFESLFEDLQELEENIKEHIKIENTVLLPRIQKLIK